MTVRPYDPETDFEAVAGFISDRRTHALWCAGRTAYPLELETFHGFLRSEESFGTRAYTAAEDGRTVGFFCLAPNRETGEAMLKFVVIDGSLRGRGLGTKMLSLACDLAFEDADINAVQLMVFSVNEAARRCYRKAGFTERSVAENAFAYESEKWNRCNMVRYRD